MDNKVTKKRINDHLEYDWVKYLIILILSIVLFVFVFGQINRERDYENVDIFVSCYRSNDNQYSTSVKNSMSTEMDAKYGGNNIMSLNLNIQDPLGKEYNTLLSTQGYVSSDILILGKRQLADGNNAGFVTLTDELLADYILPKDVSIDDLEYSYFENARGEKFRKGIRVDSFAKMNGVNGVFEFNYKNVDAYKDKDFGENLPDTEFYMVINSSSVNLGKFGTKTKKDNAQVFFCVKKFIEYYRK